MSGKRTRALRRDWVTRALVGPSDNFRHFKRNGRTRREASIARTGFLLRWRLRLEEIEANNVRIRDGVKRSRG